MSSRGQALRKLSLLKKKTSVETPEPVGGVKENYLSKCKRYLKSLPSNTVIVDTPAARGSKKVSKKKLNFVAQNADDDDDLIENEDPKEIQHPDYVCFGKQDRSIHQVKQVMLMKKLIRVRKAQKGKFQ